MLFNGKYVIVQPKILLQSHMCRYILPQKACERQCSITSFYCFVFLSSYFSGNWFICFFINKIDVVTDERANVFYVICFRNFFQIDRIDIISIKWEHTHTINAVLLVGVSSIHCNFNASLECDAFRKCFEKYLSFVSDWVNEATFILTSGIHKSQARRGGWYSRSSK